MTRKVILLATASLFTVAGGGGGGATAQLMSARDYLGWPTPAADHRISYAPGPLQFGDLRIPAGAGSHPVVVAIHGGCWSAQYGLAPLGQLMEAFRREGIATWSIEYRRMGDEGGGWPGTFDDVAAAIDMLPDLADRYPLDLDRVVLLGHSAGGHLALWAATRAGQPDSSGWSTEPDPGLRGVVSLAGVVNLAEALGEGICGTIVRDLMGGGPEEVYARYQLASPSERIPFHVPQTLITGVQDRIVPIETADLYREAAQLYGEDVRLIPVPNAGHFELVHPGTPAWPIVLEAVRSHLNYR